MIRENRLKDLVQPRGKKTEGERNWLPSVTPETRGWVVFPVFWSEAENLNLQEI